MRRECQRSKMNSVPPLERRKNWKTQENTLKKLVCVLTLENRAFEGLQVFLFQDEVFQPEKCYLEKMMKIYRKEKENTICHHGSQHLAGVVIFKEKPQYHLRHMFTYRTSIADGENSSHSITCTQVDKCNHPCSESCDPC